MNLKSILRRTRELHMIPALAGASVRGGEIECLAADGLANLSTGETANPTQFSRWYSISKGLTVLCLLDMQERGLLHLDSPLRHLLPDLRFSNPLATEHVSLRDCLLHRTGLSGGNWTWDGASADPDVLLATLVEHPCPYPLGEGFHYQNLNFMLVERAMAAAGLPWQEAILSLADRLGVTMLTDQSAFIAGPRFAPHGPNGLGPAELEEDADVRGVIASAGVCGRIEDLAAVGGLMAGQGSWQGREILSRWAWEQAVAPCGFSPGGAFPERKGMRTAMAGSWSEYRGHRLLTWAGGHLGYTSHVMAIPELKLAACALGNRSASPAPEAFCLEVLDQAAGWPSVDWPERMRAEKAGFRVAGAARLQEALNDSCPDRRMPEPLLGIFSHPAYGKIEVVEDAGKPWFLFRELRLPLHARADGNWCAAGSVRGSEFLWILTPEMDGWLFNPDDADTPLLFSSSTDYGSSRLSPSS